jgi:thiamine-phosphate pyrophosphorylase
MVITDGPLAAPRSMVDVVDQAIQAGARAVQLRNKGESARELIAVGRDLRALTLGHGTLLFVNDRLDVALSLEADGVHLGPDDLPIAAARAIVPEGFLIGRSADHPEVARRAVADGASYIGCGAVYATTTKGDAGDVIGLEGLERVARSVDVPVVAIGGITADRAVEIAGTSAAGVAVVGAVMAAPAPREAVRSLMAPFSDRGPTP